MGEQISSQQQNVNNSDLDEDIDLFEYWLATEQGEEEALQNRIPGHSGLSDTEASYAQQRLWYFQQVYPQSAAYHVPLAARLRGLFDLAILERSIGEIVRRHGTLRTTFSLLADRVMQHVSTDREFSLPVIDISSQPVAEHEAIVSELSRQQIYKPFDLAHGPVWRSALFRLTAREHILLFVMHHITTDAWSLRLFLKELLTLYSAYQSGSSIPLEDPPIQYVDFADWQRQWLQRGALQTQLQYWREQLGDLKTVLTLPTDKTRPESATFNGAALDCHVPAELAKRLKMFSQGEGVTLFMTLMAAFQMLLARYSGQDDIAVATPIANRNHADTENLLGFFVNTLILRTRLDSDMSFRQLVQQVRDRALGAYANQDLPFEQLVEELSPVRRLGGHPLTEVIFAWQNTPLPAMDVLGLTIEPLESPVETTLFDLILRLWDTGDTLEGRLEYNTDLFEAPTMQHLIVHFQTLLESALADADQPFSQLTLLSPNERQRICFDWNATSRMYAREQGIQQFFEVQAAKTPDIIAVSYEGEHLTYEQLNRRANHLARYLRTKGVSPGSIVGLCSHRTLAMIVGVLAVLKAGAGYAALDPAYPRDRLEFMLQDMQVSALVLSDRELLTLFPGVAAPVILIGEDWAELMDTALDLPYTLGGEGPSYVIFTSGSTGRPKGIILPHRVLTNLINWHREHHLTGVRMVQHASLSFDNSVHEMFVTWSTGGTLIILPQCLRQDIPGQAVFLEEQAIEKVILPAMLLHYIAEIYSEKQRVPQHLREIITSGEQQRITAPIRALFEHLSPCSLYNHYGPSETHVVTGYALPADRTSWPLHPAIGRPIDNTQIYLLDRNLQLVPMGVQGEIYIGGDCLAHGYFQRPDQTAERFVPDPFAQIPGKRLYRTGDGGKYQRDGNILFLGRLDHQVKIRGYRIEPAEVEAIFFEHPAICEVAVQVVNDDQGEKMLAAYVVPEPERAQTVEGQQRLLLANNLAVLHLLPAEAEAIYRDIFEEMVYTPAAITLGDGDCVFDVGANIGLFSLYVALQQKRVRIFAFEPVAELAALLRFNLLELYHFDATIYTAGLSSRESQSTLTFYPRASAWSGFYADQQEEERQFTASVQNEQNYSEMQGHLGEYIEGRFAGKHLTSQLMTLSHVIREQGIKRIDLLKINVEKSELDVLLGIEESDWQRIRQIVVEVHNQEGRVEYVRQLCIARGYQVWVTQVKMLRGTDIYHLYAVRPVETDPAEPVREIFKPVPTLPFPFLSVEELRAYARTRLPEYMLPSAFVLLDALPLTSNGKVNRLALPPPGNERPLLAVSFVEPGTPLQITLAQIWTRNLEQRLIGIHDNFFDLGGHSIAATVVLAQLREQLQIELTVRDLFEHPTIADLADYIETILQITREIEQEMREGQSEELEF